MMRVWCWSLFLVLSLSAPAAAQAPQPLVAGADGVPVPERIGFVQPVYPPEALAQGLRGIVILELLIDESGNVEDVEVVRSVPPFDDAAIEAVRGWRYEPVEVDGRRVSVRLTVPISFLMKLPDMTRQEGIPELRAGASPPFPPQTEKVELVVADLTLSADGQVATADILEGTSPWADALIGALRTWRFDDNELDESFTLGFRIEAHFVPEEDDAPRRVDLVLNGLTRSEAVADAGEGDPDAAAMPDDADPAPQAADAGAPAPGDDPGAAASGSGPDVAAARDADAAPAEPGAGDEPAEAVADSSLPELPAVEAGQADADTEVLGGPVIPRAVARATPEPEEPGISSVRGVFLEVGVPDLASGRRPIVPPLARMQAVQGIVAVRFAVDAAGQSFVSAVDGPELLRDAARAAVESWLFSRESAERIYLLAELSYEDAVASAVVKRER